MQTQIQEEIIKILPKGIVTIPKKFRQALGIEENSLARIREEKGRIILEPVRILPYPVRKYKDKEIDGFIAKDIEESRQLRKRGLL